MGRSDREGRIQDSTVGKRAKQTQGNSHIKAKAAPNRRNNTHIIRRPTITEQEQKKKKKKAKRRTTELIGPGTKRVVAGLPPTGSSKLGW